MLARGNVVFKAAVINAYRQVDILRLQLVQRRFRRGKSIAYFYSEEVIGRLPMVYIMRYDTGQPDAQSVFERYDGCFFNAAYALNVCAQALRAQRAQKPFNFRLAVVEVVIPKRDEIVSAEIQQLGRDAVAAAALAVQPVSEGAALKRVPAVDDECVPAVLKIAHAVCKAAVNAAAGRVIDGGEEAVRVACVIYPEFSLHNCPF